MEQRGNDNQGILGFLTEDIQKELRRGRRLVCSYCKKIGATLGCCNVRCKRIFHFPCGLKAGSLHQYFGEFRSYCINHRPKQKITEHILKQISPLDNILCYICYEKVNCSDFVGTLWAPCCKKNAFFHRKCIQQLASSAGYFFKCPLCNNKEDFRNAMLQYGIFIPSQDASWELVPNAFEELLYRHDQCDAVKCLCPKGRKHVSSNAKWELTLCQTCGSQGIHMACGHLKWANPIWECAECTSILNSKNNEDEESNNSSDHSNRDSDSDSSTDTEISVGVDFPPVPYHSPIFSSSSSSISLDSVSDIRLRPGPRSFKLQQQLEQKMSKWFKSYNAFENDEKEVITIKDSQDINTSAPKNNDKEKSLTSKENNSQKEKQVSSSNVKSQLIQKEADVITIESDDDNEVEIITLTQRTSLPTPLQLTSCSSKPHISSSKDTTNNNSPLNTVLNSITSKSSNATSTNLLEKDNVNSHKSVASKPEISNKTESIVSEQLDVATSQKSTPDLIVSNNNDLDDTEDRSKSPIMNIKITNVTSLPPEVFESVPDVICDDIALHENSIDTSSPSTSKTLEDLVTYVLPPKRTYEEVNSVVDNCKKFKGNNFAEESCEKNSTTSYVTVASNVNEQQNGKMSPIKTNEIYKDNNLLKCTFVNELSNSYNDERDALPTTFTSFHDEKHTSQVTVNYFKENAATFNVQQKDENPVKPIRTYLPSSKRKNQTRSLLRNIYPKLMPDPNLTTNQEAGNNGNMYSAPSSNVPMVTNNNIVINQPQTIIVNQSINTTVPILVNGNQTEMLDKKTVLPEKNSFTNVSSPGDSSSNNIFCDGDAGGTCPAEIDSRGQKKTDPSSEFCGRMDSDAGSHISAATRSVFPRITNNHSTCHQPRLIPQYMNLYDLKFRVCEPDNIQMVLYDTFSVNIPINNSKESKIRTANGAASRELKELSYHAKNCPSARDEASSTIDYIDDLQTAEQRFVKFSRSLKNETHLINDKTKYIARGKDDAKENLDPVRSKMLLRNSIFGNNLENDIDDTMTTVEDSFCGETDNEMRLVSSDTNLSTLNKTISNRNVEDNVIDDVAFVSNDRNQILQANWEDIQQHKQVPMYDIMTPTEDKTTRSFYKETNRMVHNVDFDFNIVKTNKNIEKILQDDITISTNRHNRDSNRKIGNDHTDDSQTMLRNSYKHLDSTNVMRPKVQNLSATRISSILFNEHSILNKQINASYSVKFIRQCLTVDEKNNVNRNENNIKNNNSEDSFKCNNSEPGLKVSIDLYKIQNLIDSKPELFVNQKCNIHEQRKCTTQLYDQGNCTQQQVRYNIENSDSINHHPSKSKTTVVRKLHK